MGCWRYGRTGTSGGAGVSASPPFARASEGRRDAAGLARELNPRRNRRQRTSFSQGDYAACLEPMAESCGRDGVDVWACLQGSTATDFPEAMHRHEVTSRPLGGRSFVQRLEALPGQTLLPRKPGPKPKAKQEARPN